MITVSKRQLAGKQVAGMILSPDWIADPRRADPYIREMADHNYAVVDLFVRHMRFTVLDPAVHAAVKSIVSAVHRRGMKCILDTDHTFWGVMLAERHPEAALWVIGGYETIIREGRFQVRAVYPRLDGQVHFQELCAVFQPSAGGFRQFPLSRVRFDWQNYSQPDPGILLQGSISGRCSGPMVFYVAFKTYGYADLAHPRYLQLQKQILDQYADVPLDGMGWDEPGKGMAHMGFFKAGAGFLRFFRQRQGYDLRSRLIFLDHLDGTSPAVKIRCDYYDALNEMNYIAQKQHNDHARKLAGKKRKLIFGTHQTWSGLPADMAGGVVDYFRLGRVLTAAWTDGAWDFDPKYPSFNFMLAEGLRKELGLRDAYYNDWTARLPVIEDMRFANRYKMLFHVNWFNIFFSDHSESLLNWRLEPVKSAAKREITRLDRFDALLGDNLWAHTDVAWLFLWEGMAAAPKWYTRVHYTACANTAQQLADRGLFAAMMGVDSIRRARIGRGAFSVGPFTYKVLIVPLAYAIPMDVYRKVLRMAEQGVAVVFVGPPPSFAAENGRALGADFARRIGFRPFSFADYQAAFAERHPLPSLIEWEPEWVHFSYPLTVTNAQETRDSEGELLYVKSARHPLYYMSQPDPREDLCNLVESLAPLPFDAYAERTYWRLFRDSKCPGTFVVYAAAKGRIADAQLIPTRLDSQGLRPPRRHSELKVLFRIQGEELSLRGGTWCAVKFQGGHPVEAIGNSPDIQWRGGPVKCKRI